MAGASVTALAPQAQAQIRIGIGFNMFHGRLQNTGRWMRHPIWGDVWRPRTNLVGRDFQPYTNGYWEYTDEYGWYWVSDDPFDDVVYHYGRWVFDPDDGWLWIPGYTWAPAWVVWRGGGDYTGWMPMPPDETFVSGTGLSLGFNLGSLSFNLYRNWYGNRVDPGNFWVFVDNRHLAQRDYRRFRVPRDRVRIVIDRTRDVTKLQVVNNHIVNRSVDVKVIERASGRRIAPVAAKTVIKPNSVVTTVDESKQIRQRERKEHPIDVNAFRRGEKSGPQGNPNGGAAGAGGNGPGGNANTNAGGAGAQTGAGGAGPGGKPSDQTQTTGEKPHRGAAETSSPKTNGPAGASETGPGQSDENTTSAPGGSPKKKRGADSGGASATDQNATSGAATGSSMGGPSGSASTGDETSSRARHRKSGGGNGEAANATGGGGSSMSGPATNGGSMNGPSGGTTETPSGGRRTRSASPSGAASSATGAGTSAPSGTSPDDAKPRKKKQKETGDSNTPPQQ